MRQRALSIIAPVDPGTDLDALETSLHAEGGGWQGGDRGPFAALDGLHYLSCCVVRSSDGEPALVVLELNFDGRARPFLAALARGCRAEIDRIFASCEGYPGPAAPAERVVAFLREHRHREALFYLGHPGRSVQQVREEKELRSELRPALDHPCWTTRTRAWGRLRTRGPAEKPPRLPFLVRYSLNGWRGPKRALELVRPVLWAALLLAGVAAYCGFAAFAVGSEDRALQVAALGALLGPLVVAASYLWLHPKHLTPRGAWIVTREALPQAALGLVYSAVVVGLAAALLPGVGKRWMPFPVWDVLATAMAWTIGIALALAALVSIAALAYLLLGWGAGLVACLVVLGPFVWGLATDESFGPRDVFVSVGPPLFALVLVAAAAAAAVYLPRLRRREAADAVAPARWDNEHLARMTEHEDRQFQNHFASVTTVKDELRLIQLRIVLRLIHLLGRIYFNQGELGSIPSIHFARYVILRGRGRGRTRLLFLTNYDGGWPNYLGEFSHVPGVTLVWGNTEHFPRPFLLGGDGSRDEQRFKTWARDSQIKTLIWYAAYPELSVVQVNRNSRFRQCLARPLDIHPPRVGPLRPFWRAFRQPLDEAALDEALRSLTN